MDIYTGARCAPVFILFIHNIEFLLGHTFDFFADFDHLTLSFFYPIIVFVSIGNFSAVWMPAYTHKFTFYFVLKVVNLMTYFLLLMVYSINIRSEFLLILTSIKDKLVKHFTVEIRCIVTCIVPFVFLKNKLDILMM